MKFFTKNAVILSLFVSITTTLYSADWWDNDSADPYLPIYFKKVSDQALQEITWLEKKITKINSKLAGTQNPKELQQLNTTLTRYTKYLDVARDTYTKTTETII